MISEGERLARIGLARVSEPGDETMHRVVAAHGAVAAWSAIRAADSSLPEGLRDRTRLRVRRVDPGRDVERAAALGARLVCPGDDEWPESLDGLPYPPLVLWVRGGGRLGELARSAVAIVGSRASTGYGNHVAAEFASGLADRGWTVVSGGAYGIDAAAHSGALVAGGTTVAVLACGVDVIYPGGHVALFRRIANDGVLVSEWPPGCDPARHRFLIRNRVIAALGAATVVVEAAVRSGARATASYALHLGRPLLTVPGQITSEMSVGCHQLLRDGAVCVTRVAEVLEALEPIGVSGAPDLRAPDGVRDGLPEEAQRTLDAVPRGRFATPSEIASAAGLDGRIVLGRLATLRGAGLVDVSGGGYRLSGYALEKPRRTAVVDVGA